jgi:hypothetical protein
LIRVLEIKKKYYGEDHVQYAKTLSKLAQELSYLGDNETAK